MDKFGFWGTLGGFFYKWQLWILFITLSWMQRSNMNTYIRFWWLMARHKKSPPTEDTTWTEQYFCFGRLHKPTTMVVVLAETRNTVWEGVIQYLSIVSEWTQVYANMSTPPRYLFIAIKVKLTSSSMRGIPYAHVSVLKIVQAKQSA